MLNWKQTLLFRQRLSAWGAVNEDPTETYLALKGENSIHPGWSNALFPIYFGVEEIDT
jgi:hypothetical protein